MTAGVFSAFIWLHTEHTDVPNWVEFYQKDAKVFLASKTLLSKRKDRRYK